MTLLAIEGLPHLRLDVCVGVLVSHGSSWIRAGLSAACPATLPNPSSRVHGLTARGASQDVDATRELAHHPEDVPAAVAHHHVVRRVAELAAVALRVAQQPREAEQGPVGLTVLLLRPLAPLARQVYRLDDLEPGVRDGVVEHA